MPYKVPRGIRNNNPGNITHNVTRNVARWWGQSLTQNDKHFVEFVDPVWGIRAIAKTLMTYQERRLAADGGRIDSVREIISRWAPSIENNTDAYVWHVAKFLAVDPDAPVVDVSDYRTMRTLVQAIITHENGRGPRSDGAWYPDYVITDSLVAAGFVLPEPAAE